MLKLRLKKGGRKKQPTYRLVVMEKNVKRDGWVIEELGFYDPIRKALKINTQRILVRIKQGVQPTKTVRYLLSKEKIDLK